MAIRCRIYRKKTQYSMFDRIKIIHLFRSRFCALFSLHGFFRPIREFFTHLERSPLPVKGYKCWPIIATHLAIEQWEFFNLPSYCVMGEPFIIVISEYVTLTPVAERLAVELWLPVLVYRKLRIFIYDNWLQKWQIKHEYAQATCRVLLINEYV